MTDMTISETARPLRQHWRRPAIAAAGFVLSWVLGLAIFSSSTQVNASGAAVLRGLDGHQAAAALQYLLTEGGAAITLALVVLALGQALASGRLVVIGLTATAVSLTQCVLGLYLSGFAPDAHAAELLTTAINRLDGLKMFLLAGLAIGSVIASRQARLRLSSWLSYLTVALAITITISGVGYFLLLNSLAMAAWLSLPLLLIWVLAIGIRLARQLP
jgi:hypothetical protein